MSVFHKADTADQRLRNRSGLLAIGFVAAMGIGGVALLSNPPKPRPFLKLTCAQTLGPEKITMDREIGISEAKSVINDPKSNCVAQRCEIDSSPNPSQICSIATEKDVAAIEKDIREYQKDYTAKKKQERNILFGIIGALALVYCIIRLKHMQERRKERKEVDRAIELSNRETRIRLAQEFGGEQADNILTGLDEAFEKISKGKPKQ